MRDLRILRETAVEAATKAYVAAKPTDPEDILTDFLADLMHWSRHTGQDFDAALRKAKGHFLVETLPKGNCLLRPGRAP